MKLSVIIPARNEEAALPATLDAALAAASRLGSGDDCEILVVDDASEDRTAEIARSFAPRGPVRVIASGGRGAARARNAGAAQAAGEVLVFVDADTRVPPEAFLRVLGHCREGGCEVGIFRLAALEPGARAWCWWTFWDQVRRLPVARAKAMAAFLFCTRETFATFGPFDERREIGEECPLLAGPYRARRRFVYDRTLAVRTSSRRMQLQPFGYARTFLQWAGAVVRPGGRRSYPDRCRTPPPCAGGAGSAPRPHALLSRAARIVAAAPRHEFARVRIDGGNWIMKRRRWFAPLLTVSWNAWLALTGAPIRVLAGASWRRWERAAYGAISGSDVRDGGSGAFLVPAFPGVSVDRYLAAAGGNPEAGAVCLAAAAAALRSLHGTAVPGDAGDWIPLSHGDAALRNVVIDPDAGVARWVDFETRHAETVPPARRRADDLWTFARSSVLVLGPAAADRVAAAVLGACLDAETRAALRAEAADPRGAHSLLSLARAPLRGDGLEALRRAVAEGGTASPGA